MARATRPARVWYTRGHRNPQGIAFRPGSNDPYSVEHGPDVNDEVNKLVNGGQRGWNPNNGAGGYDQSKPMTDPSIEPGNTMTPVWQSGGVTVAPSGGTFLVGHAVEELGRRARRRVPRRQPDVGQRLLVMHLNGAGTALTGVRGHRARTAACACGRRCRAPTATSTSSPTAPTAPAPSGGSSRSDRLRDAPSDAGSVAFPA